MKWALVFPSGDLSGFPSAAQLRAWIHDAGDGVPWTIDTPRNAEALVVFVRSADHLAAAMHNVGARPHVLFDASEGAEVAERCAATKPMAVVTTVPQTAIAHLMAHRGFVRTTGSEIRVRATGETVLIVEHRAGQFDQSPPTLIAALDGRPLCFVGRPGDRPVAPDGVATSVSSIGAAMTDSRIGMVIILPRAPLLPDVPLAFGHDVVSERAPLYADWTLVPTIEARTVRGQSNVGIVDLLADGVLRDWLAIASGETIRSRVEVVGAPEAILDAMRFVELRHRATAGGLDAIVPYLDRSQLGDEIDLCQTRDGTAGQFPVDTTADGG